MKRKLIALPTMIFAFFFLTGPGFGQAQDFIKGFSLKFTGGYGTMATGDYNTMGKSQEQYFDDYSALLGVTRTGEFKKLNMGLEFEGELIMDLGGTFGIGFGVGYIRRSNESELDLSLTGVGSLSYSNAPIITVTPVNLSLYFFPPIAPSMNIYLYGGLGYYIGKVTSTLRADTQLVGFPSYWAETETEVKDKGLGFHAGAGLEFNIAPKIAIFIEGKGRYCKLKSWEGDETTVDSDGWTESSSGTTWYYEAQDYDTGNWYSMIALQEDKPSGFGIRDIREFKVNLTGISLRAGIRIKF